MPVLQIVILAGCAGLILLFLGLRGRRVGDHPFCRRCGFDLFGKPADSDICPECGARLLGPRQYVIGVRHRRPWAIVTGSFVLLPLCGLAGILAWGKYNGVDWQKYKPVWYLSREADGSDVRARDAAIAELINRYAAGKLTKPQVASILSQALAAQADATKPWATAWGDLIETAHLSGDLSAADWKRYVEQAVAGMYVVRYRTKVTSHMPFSYALDNRGARVGSRPTLEVFAQVVGLVVDDVERMERQNGNSTVMPLTSRPGPGSNFGPLGGRELFAPSSGNLQLGSSRKLQPWMLLDGLQPGPHDGCVRVTLRVAEMQYRRLPTTRLSPGVRSSVVVPRPSPTQRDISQLELKLPIHLDIVPSGQPLVRAFELPSLHDAIARSLRVQGVRMMSASMVSMLISCDNPPADLSFKVLIRSGAGEWPLGSFAYSRGQGSVYMGRMRQVYGMLPPDFTQLPGPTVDIVFRPDPNPAVMFSPDITDYWSGEDVVLKDVPLSSSPTLRTLPLPPGRPTTRTTPTAWDSAEFNVQPRPVAPVRGRDTF